MELYILDSLLRRSAVIDRFESLIWTERYSAWGDFELVIHSTSDSRTTFAPGTRLAMSDSYRVMVCEFIENATDSEGRQMLTVKGRSLEAVLDDRTARNTFADLNTTPKWTIQGPPAAIARYIFNQICRDNVNFADDNIPFIKPGSIFPASTIPDPDNVLNVELELQSVYTAIKELCDAYNLGFRLVRNFDKSELYFDVYTGFDRTTLQNTLAPVIFSPELDNLSNMTEIRSISNYKNVAYVFHSIGVQIVTAEGVSVDVEGFDRRVMHVDATNIEIPDRVITLTEAQTAAINFAKGINGIASFEKEGLENLLNKKRLTVQQASSMDGVGGAALSAEQRVQLQSARDVSVVYNATENAYINPRLIQRGQEELAKNRSLAAFDGELPANNPYKYDLSYKLGDLVEMRNSDGVTNQMRVTEQIFVSDGEGERSYPTLAIDLFITPGSWFAWNFSQVWADATKTWSEV